MEWVTGEYLGDDDYLEAQSDATDLLGSYYLGAARDDSGQLGIGIFEIGGPNPPLVQFIPTEEADLPRMTRVYTEVYGHLEGKVSFEDLTPRGKAIVACKTTPGRFALELAVEAGLSAEAIDQARNAPDKWEALETRLREISYTIVTLGINAPIDPANLAPGFIKKALAKMGMPVHAVRVKFLPAEEGKE